MQRDFYKRCATLLRAFVRGVLTTVFASALVSLINVLIYEKKILSARL